MRLKDFTSMSPNSEPQPPNLNGFTLIETIITLVVLSLAVVGVLTVYTTGIKGGANPLLISQATRLAQGEMDQIFGEKAAAGGFGAIVSTPGCIVAPPDPTFTCIRTVCYVPSANLNDTTACAVVTNYKHVTVTVTQPIIGTVNVDSVVTNY